MTEGVFDVLTFLVACVAGGVASVAGFGIGSILTPWLSIEAGIRVAVAAISIPHLIGTAVRFWMLRGALDRHVLATFGTMSAAGGLAGALLHTVIRSDALTAVFAALLIFAGISGLTGLSSRMRFHGPVAWIAGGISGLFGGLVGNQGGIRAAALMGFAIRRDAFVATATAVALLVDFARMPIYFVAEWREIAAMWPSVVIATVGVVAGTIAGRRLLANIPESHFRRIVSGLILALGFVMLSRI